MDDREYKRLRRLVLRCFFLSLVLIVLAVSWGSYKLKSLNAQFATQKTPIVKQITVNRYQPVYGINGTNGQQGTNGAPGAGSPGSNGQDGQNVTADQIAQAVTAYLQANPPKAGIRGPAGVPGAIVFIQTNPITGLLECRYGTDTIWQPISECQ